MVLYSLALSTAVNTTKPAETLKKKFWYSAHNCQRIFPIWNFRKQSALVWLSVPDRALPYLFRIVHCFGLTNRPSRLQRQHNDMPFQRNRTFISCHNLAERFREGPRNRLRCSLRGHTILRETNHAPASFLICAYLRNLRQRRFGFRFSPRLRASVVGFCLRPRPSTQNAR